MTTKLDIPKNKGALVYSNTGSCARLINYQISDKEKLGLENEFFNQNNDSITREQAVFLIDNNVQGLKKTDEKFYSFSINPSNEELNFIKNDKNKIKEYTRNVMENYAKNYKKADLNKNDIVWTAIIHDTRYYNHADKNVDKSQIGKKKDGNNMHIHIIVSRKTSDMKKTITVRGRKGIDNFPLFEFQKKNQETFQETFKYRVGVNLYGEMQTKSIINNLKALNNKMPLDEKIILQIAEKNNFSGKINYNIKELTNSINRGENILDPYKFIELGKKEYLNNINNKTEVESNNLEGVVYFLSRGSQTENNNGEIPDISELKKKRKNKKNLNL